MKYKREKSSSWKVKPNRIYIIEKLRNSRTVDLTKKSSKNSHAAPTFEGYSVNNGEIFGKKQNKLLYILSCFELVYSKNYFNIAKIFLLRLIEFVTNQTENTRYE